ncbi:outer envelope pore protein 24, chloroplastic-like isoform X2 [Abrus precatorius]|uniref:Outer envelope pore protein 24, chloroplastic-like isoform X2 n=1 Tax=Abrus precatorius TaxID=3816 RepID=A0A8B8LKF5_ABRPR|nr:outer envelope pore protein 24, chloroplastic-like isoform X2 [Abrus precatorius]
MKAALKGRYDIDKNGAAAATLAVSTGDVKIRASITDVTFVNGPSLTGLALAVEKPGAFIVDYNVPKKDFRFQFMNTVRVAEKPLNLTYMHSRGDNKTVLDGTLVLDSSNKVSANYVASYQTSSKMLGLEWSRNSKLNGCFKISASLDLAEELKLPKISAETTWNFEM